ncbi:MAG: hypothetical protein VCB07_12390, partial [Gammaproteobacteria bacterium]
SATRPFISPRLINRLKDCRLDRSSAEAHSPMFFPLYTAATMHADFIFAGAPYLIEISILHLVDLGVWKSSGVSDDITVKPEFIDVESVFVCRKRRKTTDLEFIRQ